MRERSLPEAPSNNRPESEQLPHRFDDPSWSEGDQELLKTSFGRSVLYGRRAHVLRFGYCEPTHPLQVYAERLLRSLPPLDKCRIIVTPGDGSVNAGAMPDGTIFVTPQLFKKAKTREALQGVLMHEWLHIRNKHAQLFDAKTAAPVEHGIVRAGAEAFSVARLHEYSADIQGSVLELDKLGMNPLGYKEFLEDVARIESKKGGGLVHGSTHERVLNIAELFTAVHIHSVQAPLHPRETEVEVWSKQAEGAHTWGGIFESLQGVPRGEARRIREVRIKEIAKIPVCLLPAVLDKLWSEVEGADAHKAMDTGRPTPYEGAWTAIEMASARLAQAVFETEIVRSDPLAAQMAAACVFSKDALLPEQRQKKQWAYLRAAAPYMFFREASIPQFLQRLSDAKTDAVEARTGLVEVFSLRRSALFDFFCKLVSEVPKTDEDVGRWWSYARLVVRSLACRVEAAHGSHVKDGPESNFDVAVSLFESWASIQVGVDFLVDKDGEAYADFYARPNIVALRKRVFSHPDAFSPDQPTETDPVLEMVSDEGLDKAVIIQRKIENFFEKQLKDLSVIQHDIESAVSYFATLERPDQILFVFDALTPSVVGAFQEIFLFLIVKRVLREHPAFQQYSSLVRELFIYQMAQDGDKHEDTVEALLKNKAHLVAPDPVTGKLTFAEETPLEVLEFLYKGLHGESRRDVLFGRVTQKNGISILKEAAELQGEVGLFHGCLEGMRPLCIGQMLATCSHLDEAVRVLDECQQAGHHVPRNPYVGPWLEKFSTKISSGELEHLPLRDQLLLGTLIEDAAAKAEYADFVGSLPGFRSLSFKEQLGALVGEKEGDPSLQAGTETVRWVAQRRSLGKQEYQYGADVLMRRVHDLEAKGSYEHGLSMLMEIFLKDEKQEKLVEFLRAGLTTRTNDLALREVILEALYQKSELSLLASGRGIPEEMMDLDSDAVAQAESDAVYRELNLNQVLQRSNAVFEYLFRMQDATKHVLLRQILGGKGGILHTEQGRLKFLSMLRTSWLDQATDDPRIMHTLEEVESALAEDKEWEVLYLGVVGLLREHLFQRTATSVRCEWKDVPQAKKITKEKNVALNYGALASWTSPPEQFQKKHWRNSGQWLRYGIDQCWKAVRERRAALSGPEKVVREIPRTPMTLVKEIASRATSIGVRTAQNFEQITDLTPAEKEDMAGLFDAVQGQWRIAGLLHLEQTFPALWDVYAEIGEHVGGGTLFTVIRGRTHIGEERVLKIVNPNVEMHLDRATGLFIRTADRLAMRHGGSYALVPGLIRDVDAWVRKELHFKGFVERDREFYDTWNEFAEGSSRYRLRVPKSYGPDIPSLIQEEYVAATNLTQWDDLVEAGHDMQSVTRLLGVGYFSQLFKGRALSDIHWGNEALTTDDEVVLFDRALLMDASEQDVKLILALAGQSDHQVRAHALEEYFSIEAGRDVLPYEVRTSIQEVSRDTDIAGARRLLITLRQHGIAPPLSFMLMMKNTRVLDDMAKKAGWKYGLIGAINA